MDSASKSLSEFATRLRLEDIPEEILGIAKTCIADAIACAIYGRRFPWSQTLITYARSQDAGGQCSVWGDPGVRLRPAAAALVNGASVHAFEQDSLRYPGAGVHPGATLVPALAAMAEATGATGEKILLAFVGACEVLFRIGAASRHSSEKLGFHAPGLTGPYGATVAAGLILGLDATQLQHALGIAGSMSGGLLAFTKARHGAMVKRLHMGRASEAGVVAAGLARHGYTGAETILDGKFGFLETYCRDADPSLLTAGLGKNWETGNICIKRFACHVTAQATLEVVRELMAVNRFDGANVDSIELTCSEKVLSHHGNCAPLDVMQAQYSVPFCIALALFRNPEDPRNFDHAALEDPEIVASCKRIRLKAGTDLPNAWSTILAIRLTDGRSFEQHCEGFKGMPGSPLSSDEFRTRYALLTADLPEEFAHHLYDRLQRLELQATLPELAPAFS